MGYVPTNVRSQRAAVMAPLAATLAQRGVKRQWFAEQMGVSFSSLWNYFAGYDRVPPTFIERACQVLGIPASFIPIPEPRDLYVQQPRKAARPAKAATGTTKGQQQHGNLPAGASDSDDHRHDSDRSDTPQRPEPAQRVRRNRSTQAAARGRANHSATARAAATTASDGCVASAS